MNENETGLHSTRKKGAEWRIRHGRGSRMENHTPLVIEYLKGHPEVPSKQEREVVSVADKNASALQTG
jgi:hypothetical protein